MLAGQVFCKVVVLKISQNFQEHVFTFTEIKKDSSPPKTFAVNFAKLLETALKTYSKSNRTSHMELFAKIFTGPKSLTVFKKSSIFDVRLGPEYNSELFC